MRASPRCNERRRKLSTTNPYSSMEATKVYKEIQSTSLTTLREPQPPYEQNGEDPDEVKSSSGTPPAGASGPRPVTAATARRRRLWEEGTLILEDPFGAYRITEITEDLSARAEESDPEIESHEFELHPASRLTYASSSNGAGDQSGHGQCDHDRCDHNWISDSRIVEPARGHGHPAGTAPADREQLPDRCTKCGVKRTEVSGSGNSDRVSFDEVDTKHALRHVRSALDDAGCIKGRPILKMAIERDLRHARQLLEDHADRNGFDT